jgi:DNA-binding FadR family transcriptional regulator
MVVKRQTLTSQCIDHILDLIRSGAVKPGQRLPTEKELTESLGVSRTCIREAMKSLESLHIVSVRPRVGAVVLEPSSEALFNAEQFSTAAHLQTTDALIEFRRIVEVGLAALAAEKADEQDLEAMQRAIDEHRQAVATGAPAYPADIAFHVAVARASKNPIAIIVFHTISKPLTEQRRRTNEVPHAAEDGLRDHLLIFDAIKEHDPEKARNMMLVHMDTAEHYAQLAKLARASEQEPLVPVHAG